MKKSLTKQVICMLAVLLTMGASGIVFGYNPYKDSPYTEQLWKGNFYNQAVNPDKIELKWQFNPGDDEDINTTFVRTNQPCVSADGSTVFVYGNASNGDNYAIIAAINAFTGEKKWTLKVEANVAGYSWSSLVYNNGYVYWAGSNAEKALLYKINAQTGSTKQDDGGWVATLPQGFNIVNASPTIGKNEVFISSYTTSNADWTTNYDAMHAALSIADGSLLWENNDGGTGQGAMAYDLARNRVYQTVYIDSKHRLRAYEAETGEVAWTSSVEFANLPSQNGITYKNNKIYLSTYNFMGPGKIYVLDPRNDGSVLWSADTPESGDCTPTVDDNGNVYVFGDYNDEGQTRAYDEDGNILWTSTLGGGWQGSPAVVDNVVFAGAQNGNILNLLSTVDGSSITTVTGSSTPAIGNRAFYTVGTDGILYAYSLSNDFANAVTEYIEGDGVGNDYLSNDPYNDPNTALGRPTVDTTGDDWYVPSTTATPVVNVAPAWRAFELVSIGKGGSLTLEFDHNITDDPDNPYGIDFIIYSHPMMAIADGDGWKNGDPNDTKVSAQVYGAEPSKVFVSQDGTNWIEYTDGPFAADFPPTFGRVYDEKNPYHPDADWDWNNWWGKPTDATLPVDPRWTPTTFEGKTVRECSEIYGLAAGGVGFDLKTVGLKSIKYIKIISSDDVIPEVDAIADARIDTDITPTDDISDFSYALDETGKVYLNWNNPFTSDFKGVIITRSTEPTNIAPLNGTAYFPDYNSTIGNAVVVYNGDRNDITDTLTEGGTYYYTIYTYDKVLNYSAKTELNFTVHSVKYTSTLGGMITGTNNQIILDGENTSEVTATPATGYHFESWSDGVTDNPRNDTAISEDITITANFAIDTFEVTFDLGEHGTRTGGGELIQTVNYSESATAPEFNVEAGWHFTGWDTDFSNITADTTVTAQYEEVPFYTVTFDLGEHGTRTGGGELEQSINEGEAAVAPEFDVEAGWNFTGWDTDFSNITEDTTVTAQYEAITYTVTFDLGEQGTRTGGGELVQTVNYGEAAVAPEFDVEAAWTFTGWDKNFSNITEDTTVTALYTTTTFMVTFYLGEQGTRTGGGELHQTVNYGEAAIAPEFDVQAGWTFKAWDIDFSNITANTTVVAQYEEVTYTVTFIPGEHGIRIGGGELEQTVTYGDAAIEPLLGVENGWEFTGWDTDFSNITEDITVTAQYKEVPKTYTVIFNLGEHGIRTGGGELLQKVSEGEAAVAPEFDVEDGWIFTGWNEDFSNITEDTTVTARYELAPVTYTVIFDLGEHGTRTGGGELVQTVNEGEAAIAPEFNVEDGWAFTGWNEDFSNITADTTVTAQYEETLKVLTVGMTITVPAKDVDNIGSPAEFEKAPKIYGVIGSKNASLKTIKDSLTPQSVDAVWSKNVTLYDKKAVKGNYAQYIDNNPAAQPVQTVTIKAKGKNSTGKFDGIATQVQIVPPVFDSITGVTSMDATITINGKYFGTKAPKVSLEDPQTGKLIKLKVVKEFAYSDYKGKPSCMDSSNGKSTLKVTIPSKNLTPGVTYPLVIDNKIGIAVDENGKLPRITIK